MKVLKNRFLFYFSYFTLWVVYFILARAVFLTYYTDRSAKLSLDTIFQIFYKGLKLDFSMTAYLCIIPFILIALSVWMSNKLTKRVIKYYTIIIVFVINFLMLFDIGLYEYWGIRLDITPFVYLDTPSEMLASITIGSLILDLALWLLSSLIVSYSFVRLCNIKFSPIVNDKIWHFFTLIIVTACLGIIMRGGFQNSPINQSDVYFSEVMFANHAAVNFAWNFNYSLNLKDYEKENPFLEFENKTAKEFFLQAKNPLLTNDSVQFPVLKSSKPNVVLIIWESLTAKVVEPLGGEPNITEHFNQLCKEGILFTNF